MSLLLVIGLRLWNADFGFEFNKKIKREAFNN